MGDGKPFGARRDVAELAAKMGGDGRHLGRAEYNARACLLGGAIAVNLIEPAFRLVDATQDPGVDELFREPEGGGPGYPVPPPSTPARPGQGFGVLTSCV